MRVQTQGQKRSYEVRRGEGCPKQQVGEFKGPRKFVILKYVSCDWRKVLALVKEGPWLRNWNVILRRSKVFLAEDQVWASAATCRIVGEV